MKKLISVLLALCLVCALLPVLAEESVAGTWYLFRGEANGVTFDISSLTNTFGLSMTLELKEDGTFVSTEVANGETTVNDGTWSFDGSQVGLSFSGVTQYLNVKDGEIVLDAGGATLYLSREVPSDEPVSFGTPVKAESISAFNGDWTISKVSILGIVASAEDVQMDSAVARIVVLDGVITEYATNDAGEPIESVYNAEFNEEEGVLTYVVKLEDSEIPLSIATLEDGNLLLTMTIKQDSISVDALMLYVPTEAAAEPAA